MFVSYFKLLSRNVPAEPEETPGRTSVRTVDRHDDYKIRDPLFKKSEH